MSRPIRFFFNTGGVDYSAAELEAVLTEGTVEVETYRGEAVIYTDGDGWEGWEELDGHDLVVQIDGEDKPMTIVSYNSGGEGDYDTPCWMVLELEGRFFRIDGRYRSFGESTWGGLREVHKGTKTVEVYE